MTKNEFIYQVVDAFYEKAKIDILIGYHFRIIEDFEEHIPRIVSFWEIQLLGKNTRPLKEPFDLMKVHLPLGIKRGELGRWLLLFRKTLDLETEKHPEFQDLKSEWDLKLVQFEKIFLRFLGF